MYYTTAIFTLISIRLRRTHTYVHFVVLAGIICGVFLDLDYVFPQL